VAWVVVSGEVAGGAVSVAVVQEETRRIIARKRKASD